MKKLFGIITAIMMVFVLVACGEKSSDSNKPQQNAPVETVNSGNESTTNPVENNAPAENTNQGGALAKNGTITLKKSDVAVVVNGTSVKMPYNLKELEAAGVPADESRAQIELKAGDIFNANLYLDENEDYVLVPAYQNKGESAINIAEAEAEEITMTTYADNPEDQGLSILGVPFGMTKSDLKAHLGEPTSDSGSYFEWHIEIPDMSYEGTLSIYTTEDADDAGVSQVNLTVFEK